MDEQLTEHPRTRHGCLTVWLVGMIVANAAVSVAYLTMANPIGLSPTVQALLAAAAAANVLFGIALFRWRRWGFWGFVGVSAGVFIVNISILTPVAALSGLVGVALLYGVLRLGDPSGWDQLD